MTAGLIALATLAAFWSAVGGAFQWDDVELLLTHASYRGFGPGQLAWMWSSVHLGHYTPLTWMSFALDHALWGLNPVCWHLTNLLIHAANAALFFFLTDGLLEAAGAGERRSRRAAAALAALLFALHPLRVESVAWITERRGLLCGFFSLCSLLCYLKAKRGASLGFFAAAVLSKEVAVSLPAVLLVLDVYPLRRVRWGARKNWGRVLGEKALFAIPAFAVAVFTLTSLSRHGYAASWEVHGPEGRLAQLLFGLAFYVRKTLWPAGLAPMYELSLPVTLSAPVYALSALGVAAAAGAAWIWRRRWPAFPAAALCYAALLLPTSGLFQGGRQAAADRYAYLAGGAWVILAAGAALALPRTGRRAAAAAGGLAALALAAATQAQLSHWRTPETLWTRAVAVQPGSAVARFNFGEVLDEAGRLPEAMEQYREAIRLDPTLSRAAYNLGRDHHALGDKKKAADYYRRAIWVDPRFGEAHNNLGRLLAEEGRWEEAAGHYAAALEIYPDSDIVKKNAAAARAHLRAS